MEFLLFNQEEYNHLTYNFRLLEGTRGGKRNKRVVVVVVWFYYLLI